MKTETETPVRRVRLKRTKPILDLTFPDDQVEHAQRMVDYANNQEPVIEKGIPMPDRPIGRGPNSRYRFQDMEVGDSYFRAGDPKKATNALRQAAINAKKRKPEMAQWKFVTLKRNMEENGEVGARLWRQI